MSNNFVIKTEQFEGPFDALLSFIEKKKLHISEVSLASIADDYINFVKQNEFQLKEASTFVVIAATLAYIKSRSLLPTFDLTETEEQDAEELQERLALFAVFTKVSQKISQKIFKRVLHERIFRLPKKEIVFTPDEQITVQTMQELIHGALSQTPQDTFVPEKKVEKQLSLKEILENISIRIKRFVRANFSELVVGDDKKGKAISFLAVLELYKQGFVDLSQDELFGNIVVENSSVNTPFYGEE